jgi:molecular chaperone HtpG
MQSLTKYDDKMLRSITKEGLELDSEEEKKEKEQEVKEKTEEFKPLIDTIKNALSENIKDVTLSSRLVDSPVCLVSGAYDMSAHMERAMKAMGQAMPESKRILEINAKHPVFNKMKQSTKETQVEWAKVLYNQALLDEGSPIKDPHEFSRQICNLMMKANV